MNMKRMRGRNNRGGPGGGHGGGGQGGGGAGVRQGGGIPMNRNHVFDSSGPDLRIRGTAQQLFEKYLQLGRDATGVGDRVMAESYFQYAEHYFRIINAMTQAQIQQGGAPAPAQNGHQNGRSPRDSSFTEIADEQEREQDRENDREQQDREDEPAGYGDQPEFLAEPNGAVVEQRRIPIAAEPPEA